MLETHLFYVSYIFPRLTSITFSMNEKWFCFVYLFDNTELNSMVNWCVCYQLFRISYGYVLMGQFQSKLWKNIRLNEKPFCWIYWNPHNVHVLRLWLFVEFCIHKLPIIQNFNILSRWNNLNFEICLPLQRKLII